LQGFFENPAGVLGALAALAGQAQLIFEVTNRTGTLAGRGTNLAAGNVLAKAHVHESIAVLYWRFNSKCK
jgi:hypothetical protein